MTGLAEHTSCYPGVELAAVLFDMDGTLVSTEETWLEVEHAVMARLGGPWSEEHQAALVGGPLEWSARYMVDLAGAAVPPSVVADWLVEGMADRLRAHGARWLPGARELVAEVRRAGLPTALVSASYRRLVDLVVAELGVGLFDVTVAGDEVRHSKPDPEAYLAAAARLGVPAAGCVAVEDSLNGTAAAPAAGCVTVAVPSVVAVPPAPRLTIVESLTAVRLDDLRRLVRCAPPR